MHSRRLGLCLLRRGYRIAVLTLCPEGGRPGCWGADEGLPLRLVRRLPPGRWRNCFFAAETLRLLLTAFRNYGCIYWNMTGLHATVGLPVAHWLGIRNVVRFAGDGEIANLSADKVGPILIWMMRRWADRIVVLNPKMMADAEGIGLLKPRAVLLPVEVDTEEYAPVDPLRKEIIRRELGFSAGDLVLVFAGRFVREKCLPDLIEAFAITRREIGAAKLVLVGDGPLMPAVRKRIEELGLGPAVRLPGFLEAANVIPYLKAAELFVMVSDSEGMPAALVEAQAVGLPAVVTAIPALTQVVQHGVHGLCANPGDPVSIAACLSQLLRDAKSRDEMGKRAREHALAVYSMDKMTARFDAFFRDLREATA